MCVCANMPAHLARRNQYDGVEEFWVDVRTHGEQSYQETDREIEKSTTASLAEVLRWH